MKPRLLCALVLIVLGVGLASFDASATQSGTVNIVTATGEEVIYANLSGKLQTLLVTVCNDAASADRVFAVTTTGLGVSVSNIFPNIPQGECETASHDVAAAHLIVVKSLGGAIPVTGTYQIDVVP